MGNSNRHYDIMSKSSKEKKSVRGPASYDREKLYFQVWTRPTENIAEKYGVTGSTIRKMCRAHNIPLPPISYWQRDPKQKDKTIRNAKGILNFLSNKDIVDVTKIANSITLSETVRHPILINHQKSMKKWAQYHNFDELAPINISTFDKNSSGSPALWGCISTEMMPRAYLILDSLFSAFEMVGCTVNSDLSIVIRNETVRFNITECKSETPHTYSDKETEYIEQCLAEGRDHAIRSIDYSFNGQLCFAVEKDCFVRDTGTLNLEDRLCEIFLLLYAKSEKERIIREINEDKNREESERKLIKKMYRAEHDRQIDMLRELENEAEDFERAQRIRRYISAFNQEELNDENRQWVEWASGMADWLDPSIAAKDKYFGRREHKKSEKEKKLLKFKSE